MALRLQDGERQGAIDGADVVRQLVEVAVREELPAPPRPALARPGQALDRRRAVVRQRVVPLGLRAQLVDLLEVAEQQHARVRGRRVEPVHVDVLAADIRAEAHDVALVRDDEDELVLAEEPAQRGVLLALSLARLDRDGQVLVALEPPAQDRVSDERRSPVDEEEIQGAEPREVQRAILEVHGVVGLGPILDVADVVHDHAIAVDVGKGQRRHVGLPVALVGRRDGQPRREDHDERPQDPGERPPARAHEPDSDHRAHQEENAERGAKPRRPEQREVEVDGQRHPSEQDAAPEPHQDTPYPHHGANQSASPFFNVERLRA